MSPTNNGTDILILHSNNDRLSKKLVQWASQTNSVIICNPPDLLCEQLQNLFAIVIDSEIIETLEIPENVCERVIPAELNENLILKILNDLKPNSAVRNVNRFSKAAGYA